MPTRQGRNTANYQRLSAAYRTESQRQGRPCWLCQQPIDYTLPADDQRSYSTDHVEPLSLRPDLAEDIRNFRASHLDCNKRRGNRPPPLDLGQPSRRW